MKSDAIGLLVGFFLFVLCAVVLAIYEISTWWGFLLTVFCFVIPFGIGMSKSGMYK